MIFITIISKQSMDPRQNYCLKNTDSFVYGIETKDFYKDISIDVNSKFDTSNFPEDHPTGIKSGINKKVVGLFKDEAGGEIIDEFVGLRPKLYF